MPLLALLPALAPVLGPIIGRLIAGAGGEKAGADVAGAVGALFGGADEEKVRAALADPQQVTALAVRLAEIAAQREAAADQARLDAMKAAMADTANARQQNMTLAVAHSPMAWGAPVVSLVAVLGFFGSLYVMATHDMPADPNRMNILNIMVGVLGTGFAAVLNFWLGSSYGSVRKTDMMAAQPQQAPQAPPIATTGDVVVNNPPAGSTATTQAVSFATRAPSPSGTTADDLNAQEIARFPSPPGTTADELNDRELTRVRPVVPPPVAPPSLPAEVAPADGTITTELLGSLGWVNPSAYARAMAVICPEFGITGRLRVAAWLAQTGHESGKGKWRKEIWGPTEAQKSYEGRASLGNTQPGDGSRFRGRGLIQVTGRDNYARLAKALDIPLEQTAEWLETLEGAVTGSAWWWRTAGCNEIADTGDMDRLTKKINGGYNGLDERRALYAQALAAVR